MKVGDLIELSTYGKKLKSFRRLHERCGIVIERVHELSRWKIHWFGPATMKKLDLFHWFGTLTNVMNRKDIKHVKAKKHLTNQPNYEIIHIETIEEQQNLD